MMKISDKLLSHYQSEVLEVGCDEAGRGCLAGPVFAAAVIFPIDYYHPLLNDSKKISAKNREKLRTIIEEEALDFAVASVSAKEIDEINIHQASYLAMHRALDNLNLCPQHIIVDGNKFVPYKSLSHNCIIKGDGKYLSIAAASILAKTYRDEYMLDIAREFPMYSWNQNKGYPTTVHRIAIAEHGVTEHHRKTFRLTIPKLNL